MATIKEIKEEVAGEEKEDKKKKKEDSEESREKDKEKDSKKEKEYKISDLPGIGPGTCQKLEEAGIYDLMGIAVLSPTELSEMAGLGEAVARKAIQAARKMMSLGFQDGMEFAEKRKEIVFIGTGSKNLDNLLGGKGVETKAMTECFGAYGSGKCVSKDTEVCYLNDEVMHIEPIEKTYEKYFKDNEIKEGEGFAIPLSTVKVQAWNNGKIEITSASNLYREKVKKIFVIKTKRGRVLKTTGMHQVLSFDNGVCWKRAGMLNKGDLIASPKLIDLKTSNFYDEDDAYFLGLFVAEGTFNPFSITIADEKIKNWLCLYIERKFGYKPYVGVKQGNIPTYVIVFRNSTRPLMDGLDKCNSSTKFIPEKIFLSNESIILSFLGGYFDGDGEVSKEDISATTKSKILATQLSYLLLRLGVTATTSDKIVDGKTFKIIRISGEDREKLKKVKFKIKSFSPSILNSAYGYPDKIIEFIREIYKETIGGNRGGLRKEVGKFNSDYGYRILTNNSQPLVINTKTLEKIEHTFLEQKNSFVKMIAMLENEKLSFDMLKEFYPKLPFAFNILSENMGLKKSSIRNYYYRKIPQNKIDLLQSLILNELKTRVDVLLMAFEMINEIRLFNWDIVENIELEDYNDYVYDFVVPEGHSFLGGNMPTMMHNSQIGFSLAVRVQLPVEMGGANGKAAFIDTEATFRPERIKQIANGLGLNPENVLKNIFVARALNADHQILLIDKINEMIKNGEPIKLIVVDSLTAHFRAEFTGRGQLADRQQKLNKYLHSLMKLAESHNLAIYITNQVMANPGMMFGDPTTPVGGNIVGHMCLTGDSLIQLADGSINQIQSMKQEQVMSGDFSKFNFNKANCDIVFINPNVNEIYNIKTNNQISCSKLHRFFCVDNFSLVEKEAKDLKVGDFVAQAGIINIPGDEQKLPEIKIKKIVRLSKEDSIKIKEELDKGDISRKEICAKIGITPRQFRRILNQSYPTNLNSLEMLQNSFGGRLALQLIPAQTYKYQNLTIPQIMIPQLAQICGYFIGDGNFEPRGLRFRDARYDVLSYYSALFKQVFERGGNISKMSNKNCFTLDVNSVEIANFFRLLLPNIFNYIGKSKNEVVGAFIKGFIDAEGHIDKKRPTITAVQREREILRYLQMFLLRFGIRSTIKFGIGDKKINVLRIADRDIINYSQIGFTALDKQKTFFNWLSIVKNNYKKEMMPVARKEVWKLLRDNGLKPSLIMKSRDSSYNWINRNELQKAFMALMNCNIKDRQIKQKIEFIKKLLNGEIVFDKIREINISENKDKQLFYDFSVPLQENYIANGFVVHNSTYRVYLRRGKKGSRVAKLIDSPNLPENETIFFLGANGISDEETSEE